MDAKTVRVSQAASMCLFCGTWEQISRCDVVPPVTVVIMVTVDNCLNSPHETATYAKIRDHIEPGVEDHHPLRQDGQRKRQHHASSRQHHQEGGPATTLVEEKNAISDVRGAKGRLGEIRSMYVHHHLNLSCLHSVRDRFSQTLCNKIRNQPCSSMWPSKSGHGHVHKDFGSRGPDGPIPAGHGSEVFQRGARRPAGLFPLPCDNSKCPWPLPNV